MPRRIHDPYPSQRIARGTLCNKTGLIGCHVRIDPEIFEQIRILAKKANSSFAEQMRCLVEYGIESMENET